MNMITERLYRLILTSMVMLMPLISQASDLAREERMANQIVDAILDGDPEYLSIDTEDGELEFLSIYTEADEPQGVVIILHGRGFHPDWQDAVKPLRVGLAENGWNTLSVQMPVLEKDAKYYDYVPLFPKAHPRIDRAIAFAREQIKDNDIPNRVVLLAHSCGAHMAMSWVEAGSFESIDAYIGIGMGATDYGQPMRHPFPLKDIKVPVLDVYAEDDFPAVLKMAPDRLKAMRSAGNPLSAQAVVEDANHYYTDKGDELLDVVAGWLGGLALTKP